MTNVCEVCGHLADCLRDADDPGVQPPDGGVNCRRHHGLNVAVCLIRETARKRELVSSAPVPPALQSIIDDLSVRLIEKYGSGWDERVDLRVKRQGESRSLIVLAIHATPKPEPLRPEPPHSPPAPANFQED